MEALIVVDIQNDFISGSLAIKDDKNIIPEIISKINNLLPLFNLVIFTQDCHPPEHKSFEENGGKWKKHCVEGSNGYQLDSRLKLDLIKGEYAIFKKGIDKNCESYSAFYDEEGKSNGLKEFLREKEVEEVYICGIAGDYCVKYTCLDAVKCGFNTDCIRDLCLFINNDKDNVKKTFEKLSKKNIWVLDYETVQTFMEF